MPTSLVDHMPLWWDWPVWIADMGGVCWCEMRCNVQCTPAVIYHHVSVALYPLLPTSTSLCGFYLLRARLTASSLLLGVLQLWFFFLFLCDTDQITGISSLKFKKPIFKTSEGPLKLYWYLRCVVSTVNYYLQVFFYCLLNFPQQRTATVTCQLPSVWITSASVSVSLTWLLPLNSIIELIERGGRGLLRGKELQHIQKLLLFQLETKHAMIAAAKFIQRCPRISKRSHWRWSDQVSTK